MTTHKSCYIIASIWTVPSLSMKCVFFIKFLFESFVELLISTLTTKLSMTFFGKPPDIMSIQDKKKCVILRAAIAIRMA